MTGTDGSGDGDSSGEDPVEDPALDLGADQEPNSECASVSQTTTIEALPTDIVMVAVGDPIVTDGPDFRAQVANLLPYINHMEIDDAQAVFLVPGAPDHDAAAVDEFPTCAGWVCCPEGGDCSSEMLASYPSHAIVDLRTDPERPLTDLLATVDGWRHLLRDGARKHVWLIAPDNLDDATGADAFVDAFEALGPDFVGFTTHVYVWGEGTGGPQSPLAAAAERTGGMYYDNAQGDYQAEAFFDAVLGRVKTASLRCEYEIPPPPDGMIFDRDHVNVEYDDGAGLETIGYVESASDCAAVGNGWFYDDVEAPSTLSMCPYTCQRFLDAAEATIDIRFGCATIPAG